MLVGFRNKKAQDISIQTVPASQFADSLGSQSKADLVIKSFRAVTDRIAQQALANFLDSIDGTVIPFNILGNGRFNLVKAFTCRIRFNYKETFVLFHKFFLLVIYMTVLQTQRTVATFLIINLPARWYCRMRASC